MTRTLDDLPWPVRTARLAIRRVRRDDAEAMWRYRRLPAVYDWITTAPRDAEAFATYLADPHRLEVTLVVEHEGVVIGDLYLSVEDPWAQTEVKETARGTQAEIGWAFDPAYGGQGLATEAAEGLLEVCFEGLRVRRVVASCFADNTPSWRLMERLGMRRESHARSESLHRSGHWLDGYGYAMLADEWRGAGTSLRTSR